VTPVLFLIKGLGRGGAERLLSSAARYLDRARFEYEVGYLLPHKDALASELRQAGLRVRCLDGRLGAGWIGRLRSLVRERGIQLVHVHSPYVAIGARLGLPRHVPIVYTEHNVWESYRPATYWGNLLTFPRNDHVFAVSDRVRASLRYPGPLRSLAMPPAETLYHGYDPAAVEDGAVPDLRQELGIPEGVPVVGTVASFKHQKGHRHLLGAAELVRRKVKDVRFVLVGQGPLEADIRRQARELELGPTVLFAGGREDAARVAGAFDVFVLPSIHEGLSVALVEAMAMGKPAVVTRAGGLPEVVEDREHGLVVPTADPSALARGILALLEDEPLRQRLGDAGRRRAADFDIGSAVRRIEAVYEELLN
jgi:glycosyltransferase involved in cell wall biosynthesis